MGRRKLQESRTKQIKHNSLPSICKFKVGEVITDDHLIALYGSPVRLFRVAGYAKDIDAYITQHITIGGSMSRFYVDNNCRSLGYSKLFETLYGVK